jgi:hypothetical protein
MRCQVIEGGQRAVINPLDESAAGPTPQPHRLAFRTASSAILRVQARALSSSQICCRTNRATPIHR